MTRILVASVGGDEKDVSTKLDVVRVALTWYYLKGKRERWGMKGQIKVKRKGKPSLGPEIFRESK